MIKTEIITRKSERINTGTMGFNDWETKYENLENFVKRVDDFSNSVHKVISVNYSDGFKTALVMYKTEGW